MGRIDRMFRSWKIQSIFFGLGLYIPCCVCSLSHYVPVPVRLHPWVQNLKLSQELWILLYPDKPKTSPPRYLPSTKYENVFLIYQTFFFSRMLRRKSLVFKIEWGIEHLWFLTIDNLVLELDRQAEGHGRDGHQASGHDHQGFPGSPETKILLAGVSKFYGFITYSGNWKATVFIELKMSSSQIVN